MVLLVNGPRGLKPTRFMSAIAFEADIARERNADANDPNQTTFSFER